MTKQRCPAQLHDIMVHSCDVAMLAWISEMLHPGQPLHMQGSDLSPAEVTRLNMDKSALLQQVVDKEYGGDPQMLLGELQVRPVLHAGCATNMAAAANRSAL